MKRDPVLFRPEMTHIAEAVIEVLERIETPAMRWMRELPQYDCPVCGIKTIFKSGCSEHENECDCAQCKGSEDACHGDCEPDLRCLGCEGRANDRRDYEYEMIKDRYLKSS